MTEYCFSRLASFHYSITFQHSAIQMSEIHFVDTTLRDGQQSLWALGMRTGAMLPDRGTNGSSGL